MEFPLLSSFQRGSPRPTTPPTRPVLRRFSRLSVVWQLHGCHQKRCNRTQLGRDTTQSSNIKPANEKRGEVGCLDVQHATSKEMCCFFILRMCKISIWRFDIGWYWISFECMFFLKFEVIFQLDSLDISVLAQSWGNHHLSMAHMHSGQTFGNRSRARRRFWRLLFNKDDEPSISRLYLKSNYVDINHIYIYHIYIWCIYIYMIFIYIWCFGDVAKLNCFKKTMGGSPPGPHFQTPQEAVGPKDPKLPACWAETYCDQQLRLVVEIPFFNRGF